ncbi:MAG: hypothetical protein Q4C68_02650, partial [Moraxella sp.]|nr:hypothetical protein [Moraxella sp.]
GKFVSIAVTDFMGPHMVKGELVDVIG